MIQYFTVRRAHTVWGDYSDILIHGLVDYDGNKQTGEDALMRADAWMPEMGLPLGMWFVGERVKHAIENSKFRNFLGNRVHISKATKVGWRNWNLEADEPQKYPAQSEPENYILARKNDETTRLAVPPVWRLIPATIEGPFATWVETAIKSPETAPHLAARKGELSYCVSEDFKTLLENIAPSAMNFERK